VLGEVAVTDESVPDDQPPQRGRLPLVRLAKGQETTLGCGTLILIAIIVAMCSGAGKTDLGPVTNKLQEMERKIDRLEKKIDEMGKKP
jgi:hypothetical protein